MGTAPRNGTSDWATDVRSFMIPARIGLKLQRTPWKAGKAAMVDLLGMFRRRPAKRAAPGFARTRDDITALGDSFGELLTGPVRAAPPIARDAAVPRAELPRVELPRGDSYAPAPAAAPVVEQPRPRPAAN